MDNDEAQVKILQHLDVISVEVAANRQDTAALHREVVGIRNSDRFEANSNVVSPRWSGEQMRGPRQMLGASY